jgi:serine/threonine-protein kinase
MAQLPINYGRYQLVERLAVGGMAELYRAKVQGEHGFERDVVIKRILPQLAEDARFRAMFVNEAKITAKLSHPKIAQTFELGAVGNELFIAMEYVEGLDALALLREYAHQQERLPFELGVYIVQEVTDALDFAHKQKGPGGEVLGIVHRDVSPSNVLLSSRGDVKLVDFGIAQAVQQDNPSKSGTLKGKYGYMSPEQIVGAKVTPKSDIFAAGIVLAEMLMGRRLFAAPNELDVLLMVRDVHLGRLERFGGDLPADLMSIIRQCLRKDPEERFKDAAELRDALSDWIFNNRKRVGAVDVAGVVGRYLEQARARQRDALSNAGASHLEHAGIPVGAPPSGESSLDIEITELAELDEAAGGHEEALDAEAIIAESEALREESAVEAALDAADVADISIPVAQRAPAPAPQPAAAADAGGDDFFDLGDLDDVDLSSASERSQVGPLPEAPGSAPAPAVAAPSQGRAETVPASPGALAMNDAEHGLGLSDSSSDIPIVVGEPVATPFQRARPPTRPPMAAREPKPAPPPPPVPKKQVKEQRTPSNFESIEAAVASLALPDPDPSAKDFDDRDVTELPRPSIKKQMRMNPPSSALKTEVVRPNPPRLKRISEAATDTGNFRDTSAIAVLFDRVVNKRTGLLVCEVGGTKKEIYFVEGRPEYVSSNVASELFGTYLVNEGVVSAGELDMALAMMPHYDGKLGDTLVGLGLVRPLDIFRHLTRQVRYKLVDVCTWQQGTFQWYPERVNNREAFPLDIEPYEVLGAGALDLTPMFLQSWIDANKNEIPSAVDGKVDLEVFQVPELADARARLDGKLSVMEHCARIKDPRERGRFVRCLYLLLSVDLAAFQS